MISNSKVTVQLDLTSHNNQIIDVTIIWKPTNTHQVLSLPQWTPGSYTIRDYSQYLFSMRIDQKGLTVPINNISTNSWECNLKTGESTTLRYSVEARSLNVRNCYIDNSFSSLCLPALIVEISDFRNSQYNLIIKAPEQWKTFVPLRHDKSFVARNYDELLDTPVHSGNIDSTEILVRNKKHILVVIGQPPKPLPLNFIDDINTIFDATCELMGGDPPFKYSYHLILQIFDRGYGGLEHDNSSVLQFNWRLLIKPEGYRKLLQLIAHEYLHQWNVRRLRPIEHLKYEYGRPQITESLWLAEGVTSYFDICIPYLAKLQTLDELLVDLSEDISYIMRTPGRKIQSLAVSSKEAWVKLYKSTPNSRNTQVSYYKLGSITAFCLDVRLRQLNTSLAQLLRTLWLKYGITNLGYNRQLIKETISEYSESLTHELDDWLDIPDSLPIKSIIEELGLCLVEISSKTPDHGMTFRQQFDKVYILSTEFNSPASKAGLITGDELIAVSNYRISSTEDIKNLLEIKKTLSVTYNRNGIVQSTTIYVESYAIDKWTLEVDKLSPLPKTELRNLWLQIL